MGKQQKELSSKKKNNRSSAGGLSYIIKRNWFWFIFSIIIFLSLAFLYISYCPQIYTRTASILIKDNSAGLIINQPSVYPLEIQKNVDKEAFILKSKQLMLKVARQLNLDINYITNNGLRKTELYNHSPVIVNFPDAEENDQFSFVVTPISENEIQLSDFSKNKSEIITANPTENNIISTSIGNIEVSPSIYYGNKYFNKPIKIIKNDLDEVAQYFSDNLKVVIPEKSVPVINISLNDISIPRNEDIINTLIAIYNEEAIIDKKQIIFSSSEFINERLLSLEKELSNANTDIETIKPERKLTDINPVAGIQIKDGNLYHQQITDLQNQRIVARNISDYILDPKHSLDLIPAYTISDPNIEMQIAKYNNLLLRRNKLILNGDGGNQDIEEVNNSLAFIKQNLIHMIGDFVLNTDSKMRNIRRPEPKKKFKPEVIIAPPSQQNPILPIEYQEKAKESLYTHLLKKREDNALLQSITESDIQIIDYAKGPEKPVSPKSILILSVALLIGIILPTIIMWLKATFTTTVRNREDLENLLTIPFLGDIPLRKNKTPGDVIVRENNHEPISEAFRIIRTNMDYMNNKTQSGQVIMLTSFDPGAGKTFISTNLAMSFALTQKKVILLDLDMRKGTLSSRISKSYSGISSFLSGKINDINEIIMKKILHETLDFIPAGPVPPNPSELLLSDRLDILIQDLKKHYDYIILDSAPANAVADATIINRISDLAIFVIRAGKTDRNQLPGLEKLYRSQKYNNMSVILNGVDDKQFGYGYGYYG